MAGRRRNLFWRGLFIARGEDRAMARNTPYYHKVKAMVRIVECITPSGIITWRTDEDPGESTHSDLHMVLQSCT